MVGPSKSRPPMSHRKTDLGIPRLQESAKVVLVIVDFTADSPNGLPVRHRISPEKVTQELKAAGYALVDTLRFLPRQYCLNFRQGQFVSGLLDFAS